MHDIVVGGISVNQHCGRGHVYLACLSQCRVCRTNLHLSKCRQGGSEGEEERGGLSEHIVCFGSPSLTLRFLPRGSYESGGVSFILVQEACDV